MPALIPEEEFEDVYTSKFDQMLHGRGVQLNYRRDRAAIDRGIHLTQAGSLELSNVKVWFQLKGIQASTLSEAQLTAAEDVAVRVRLDHLRGWYAGPEAVYLVVYLESRNLFLAEDVRDVVDRTWGASFLAPDTFGPSQDTVTIRVRLEAVLSEEAIGRMLAHRSMRIDGPAFRGRPLGHRLDPLRCELAPMVPADFRLVVDDLLRAHLFDVREQFDPAMLLAGDTDESADALYVGTFHTTWEWLFPLSVEYGYDDVGSPLREEGQVLRAFGLVAVLIQARTDERPRPADTAPDLIERLKSHGVEHLLVLANATDTGLYGSYRGVSGDLYSLPQGLSSLAYNLLTATLVYLDHRDRISWRYVNYQY